MTASANFRIPSPASIYFFKVNSGKKRITYEICSKLRTIKTTEQSNEVFIVNFEYISHIALVFPL